MSQHPAPKRICVSGSASEHDAVIDIGSVGLVQNGPWATREEAQIYKNVPKMPWAGYLPLFGCLGDFERIDVVEEQRAILMHVKSEESRINCIFKSRRRLMEIDEQFMRWRNVGCQLCFATTGRPEPDHMVYDCTSWDSCERARAILNWLEKLALPRFSDKLGACSLCSQTNCPCGDIRVAYQMHTAESEEVKDHWKEMLESQRQPDGHCENKAVVRKTIAALCAYDDQVLGKMFAKKVSDEDGVDIGAENQVLFWFERQISFCGSSVLRLLFVFEMLVCAFDFRQKRQLEMQPHQQNNNEATGGASVESQQEPSKWGWDNEQELQDWTESLDWWVGKCSFCAGRGLDSPHINHTLRACKRGGAAQRQVRLGEAIHLEGYRAQGGCRDCGTPREFCRRWEKRENGMWKLDRSKRCQYGQLVYDTVIGLFQCSDSRYRVDVYTTIEEEGDEEHAGLDDEDVAAWLCRGMTVAGVECSEIIRQFSIWTRMVQKAKLC